MTMTKMMFNSNTGTLSNSSSADDSDDEEFEVKVDAYLNSSVSTEQGALQGILRRSSSLNKVVKFVVDDEDEQEAKRDEERSRQELLLRIQRLTETLKKAEETVRTEKEKRKKKDKSLMKLAKELKKRNAQRDADMDKMEELEEKKKYLEHHWVLAQKELDQEKSLRSKIQNEMKQEFERGLQEEREKYEQAMSSHEDRISELNTTHAKQCDEFCGQILKANLEADKLANQIRSDGYTPRGLSDDKRGGSLAVLQFLTVCVAILAFVGHRVDLFSIDGLCSPVMPGRTLRSRDTGSSFSAPWWAPESKKEAAFKAMCFETKAPSVLKWLPDGKDNKIIISRDNKVIFTKRSVAKAEIEGGSLRVWNRKGGIEEHGSLWSV